MFAARAFDPTLHGGFIAAGDTTVINLLGSDEVLISADSVTLLAVARSDETIHRHTIASQELAMSATEGAALSAKRAEIIPGEVFQALIGPFMIRPDLEGIVLTGLGSMFKLSAAGITLSTPGIIDINGTLVKINS